MFRDLVAVAVVAVVAELVAFVFIWLSFSFFVSLCFPFYSIRIWLIEKQKAHTVPNFYESVRNFRLFFNIFFCLAIASHRFQTKHHRLYVYLKIFFFFSWIHFDFVSLLRLLFAALFTRCFLLKLSFITVVTFSEKCKRRSVSFFSSSLQLYYLQSHTMYTIQLIFNMQQANK